MAQVSLPPDMALRLTAVHVAAHVALRGCLLHLFVLHAPRAIEPVCAPTLMRVTPVAELAWRVMRAVDRASVVILRCCRFRIHLALRQVVWLLVVYEVRLQLSTAAVRPLRSMAPRVRVHD